MDFPHAEIVPRRKREEGKARACLQIIQVENVTKDKQIMLKSQGANRKETGGGKCKQQNAVKRIEEGNRLASTNAYSVVTREPTRGEDWK